ncbi:MAG: isopenicillin N synthase family dioxygenase, partial [Flavobacteriaceae bacterium]
MKQIPQADLNDFLSEDLSRKQAFIQHIGKAFEEIGFLALKGHFLTTDLQEQLYTEVRSFFQLPNEVKSTYEIKGGGGQRGYTGFGKEHAAGRTVGDLKEFWHFGQDFETKPFLEGKYSKNLTVKELENFNKIGNLVFLKLEETAKVLLQALALYLDLDEYYFDAYVSGGNSILRAIHYPPIKEPPKEAVRAAAHGDINLITLLMGAQGGGLQVLNRQNQWIDAVAEPD